MLELCRDYSAPEINNLKDFITVVYVIIDDLYKKVVPANVVNRRNISCSILSDSEIITIGIIGELLTIDSENAWFKFCKRNLRDLFPCFCDRTRFNRTRRNLQSVIEIIRQEIVKRMDYTRQPYRIVDSIPIPVCKFGRAHFHKTFKGYGATYGICPSKKETYFGYKLHMLAGIDGFITDFALTPANVDDREGVWDLLSQYSHILLLGDKGYIGDGFADELKVEKDITILPLKRSNSKEQYPKRIRQFIFKLRRRIETSASQLSEQLNIEKVLAKSLLGLVSRIKIKLLAHSLCYYINNLMGHNINFSRIKDLVFGQ